MRPIIQMLYKTKQYYLLCWRNLTPYNNHKYVHSFNRYIHFETSHRNSMKKFDADTFFRNLRVHNERLTSGKQTASDSNLPWDIELWETLSSENVKNKTKQRGIFLAQNVEDLDNSTIHPMQSNTDSETLTNLPLPDPENHNYKSTITAYTHNTKSAQCELNDLLQRCKDLLERTTDYQLSVWKQTSFDLHRVLREATPAQLTEILHILSMVRSKNSIKCFISAENIIYQHLHIFKPKQLIQILSAYARFELLWGIKTEDTELRTSSTWKTDEIHQETSEANSLGPSSLIYYYNKARLNQATSALRVASTFAGRHFVHMLLKKLLPYINLNTMDFEETVLLLFALVAQRPKLMARCIWIPRGSLPEDASNEEKKQRQKENILRITMSAATRRLVYFFQSDVLTEHYTPITTTNKVDSNGALLKQELNILKAKELISLGIFILGRLNRLHNIVKNKVYTDEKNITLLEEKVQENEISVDYTFPQTTQQSTATSILSFLFHSNFSGSKSAITTQPEMMPSLRTGILRHAAELVNTYSKKSCANLSISVLILTYGGLRELNLQNVGVAGELATIIHSELPQVDIKQLVEILFQCRVLRYFENNLFLLPLLKYVVAANSSLNRSNKLEVADTICKILWWFSYNKKQQEEYSELWQFCITLKKLRLIHQKSLYERSFKTEKMKLDCTFPSQQDKYLQQQTL